MLTTTLLVSMSSCNYPTPISGKWAYDDDVIYKTSRRADEKDKYIPCEVISWANNDQFIIAAQKHSSICGEEEARSKTDNPLNFWIIDIDEDKVIGPLSFNEYFQKRQELNIPDDLQMDLKV
ncbi:MAG: DUF3997 domain-containing protein [Thermoleophilia bacterium]